MIRLLIVEDHPAIAEGVAALLRRSDDIEIVGIAGDGARADEIISRQRPDVVLCDVMLGGRDTGFDLLAAHGRTSRFVLFSAYDYPAHHVRAVREGAAGYLSKMSDIEVILGAIRRAAAGGAGFSAEILASVRRAPREPTPREHELLALLFRGATNDEIGERMQLRVKSVEGMLRRLFDRYAVENRTQLARYAEEQGWLTGRPAEDDGRAQGNG